MAANCSNLVEARLSKRGHPKFVRNLTILYDSHTCVCDDRASQKPAEEYFTNHSRQQCGWEQSEILADRRASLYDSRASQKTEETSIEISTEMVEGR